MQLEKKSINIYFPKLNFNMREWLPTKGNVIFTLFVISSLLWAQNVGAISLGAPVAATTSITGIPYQGRLADKNGAPLTQTVNMTFRLYAAASGGAPLWEEPWTGANSVQVSDGLFNVMLGSLTQIPQAVITGSNNLFLGITVGTDNEMSPRVQLGSVPFATQALTVPDGSITKAKLAGNVSLVPADGSIASNKLNLDHGMTCLSGNAILSLVGNSQFVDILGLNMNFSLDKSSQVLIWIDGLASFDQGGESSVSVFVDGAAKTSSYVWNNGHWINVEGQRLINLGIGTHSILGKVASGGPGTMTIHGGGGYQTCINYLVLGEQ